MTRAGSVAESNSYEHNIRINISGSLLKTDNATLRTFSSETLNAREGTMSTIDPFYNAHPTPQIEPALCIS